MFNIETYSDEKCNDTVAEYINSLKQNTTNDKSLRIKLKKIYEYIGILQKFGTRTGEPYIKNIEGKLWELRPANSSIFFFFKENKYILLHHYIKAGQKTPKREYMCAYRNMMNYLERCDKR